MISSAAASATGPAGWAGCCGPAGWAGCSGFFGGSTMTTGGSTSTGGGGGSALGEQIPSGSAVAPMLSVQMFAVPLLRFPADASLQFEIAVAAGAARLVALEGVAVRGCTDVDPDRGCAACPVRFDSRVDRRPRDDDPAFAARDRVRTQRDCAPVAGATELIATPQSLVEIVLFETVTSPRASKSRIPADFAPCVPV